MEELRKILRQKEQPHDHRGHHTIGNEPEYWENRIQKLKFFREAIYRPVSVFYPCCGRDVSPLKAFPDANLTFLDKLRPVVESLRPLAKHYSIKTICENIKKYTPEQTYDLLLLLNPQIPSKWATKYVENGKYIIANNWDGNADQLLTMSDYRSLGMIITDERAEIKLIRDKAMRTYVYLTHAFMDFWEIFRKEKSYNS